MKGDVGMSVHEKGGKQVNATPTHKTIYNPIPEDDDDDDEDDDARITKFACVGILA